MSKPIYNEENEQNETQEIEETPNQRQVREAKEKLFAISMDLESLAEDIGWPHKTDIIEVAAIIQEQCDALEEMHSEMKEETF